ncbi:murein transglycosylase [Hoeflea sp. BAL378]|uniref:lytic murein transglycosylase n=1 Tax=Hoeflea sp. BAL378 TaxID=1547437 RepID=UPI0005144B14|nr:lytic murein transglycosylase [Hoeflea sp. BAL378]KGF66862.1 murein transglycosylase [Hoeflea sp. BAL378]
MNGNSRRLAALGIAALLATGTGATARAAQCGNTSSGFPAWVEQFKQEASRAGISQRTLDSAFKNARYATKTISLDRNQKSFKLSFEQFMQKRGAASIVSKGKRLKQQNAGLFAAIESKYGVPAGPLIAIWGMESGFGSFTGNQHTVSAVATLAYDCRRSDYFTEQLYALLQLIQKGWLSPDFKGAAHGEIGQTQFLPANVARFGADGDRNGSVNLGSAADALASTANFLRGHGWSRGGGYQPGQANFGAIQGWNAAGVYQKAIAVIGAQIDG